MQVKSLSSLAPLFNPIELAGHTFRNRIVMAPMSRYFAHRGVLPASAVDYYRRRAEGGVGLIVTEGTSIPYAFSDYKPSVPSVGQGDDAVWRQVAAAVHEAGSKIVMQLWHPGLMRLSQSDHEIPGGIGPAATMPGLGRVGVGIGEEQIQDVVDAYADAAQAAQTLGFDGVNIHGAHGYLIDEFLWSASNSRVDGYGGAIENRVRIAVEIVRAIRVRCGPTFVVVFRFSQWKSTDYDAKLANSPDELARYLTPLAAAGVDAFDASTRRFWQPEFEGSTLNLAGWAKKLSGKPSICVGSVTLTEPRREGPASTETVPAVKDNLDALAGMMEREEFDMVALGRALIANPAWSTLILKSGIESLVPYSPALLETLA